MKVIDDMGEVEGREGKYSIYQNGSIKSRNFSGKVRNIIFTKDYKSEVKLLDIKLPIKKGDIIGSLLIKDDNKVLKQVNLISNSDMKKRHFLDLWYSILKSMLTGDLIR